MTTTTYQSNEAKTINHDGTVEWEVKQVTTIISAPENPRVIVWLSDGDIFEVNSYTDRYVCWTPQDETLRERQLRGYQLHSRSLTRRSKWTQHIPTGRCAVVETMVVDR